MRFVAEGIGAEPIWTHLNRQVFLGDDGFVVRMQALAELDDEVNVPRAQRRPPPLPFEAIAAQHADRDAEWSPPTPPANTATSRLPSTSAHTSRRWAEWCGRRGGSLGDATMPRLASCLFHAFLRRFNHARK